MPLGNDTCTHVESGRFSRQLLRTVHTAEIPFHNFFFFFFSVETKQEREENKRDRLWLCVAVYLIVLKFSVRRLNFSKFSFDKTCLVFFCHSRKMCSFFFLFLSPWKYLRKMCDHHHVSLDSLEWSMEWRAPSSLTFFFFSLGCWGESFDPDYEKPFPLLFRSNVKYYWSITFLPLSVTRFMTDWRVRCRKNNNNSELKQPE